jgi:hypothetical protein
MQQFIEVKFRGHLAIVKEMTLFMLTERVDPSEISNLIDRVRDAESKAAQALKTTLALEKEVLTLKRGYDNLVNDVKQLKTKLIDGTLGSGRLRRCYWRRNPLGTFREWWLRNGPPFEASLLV